MDVCPQGKPAFHSQTEGAMNSTGSPVPAHNSSGLVSLQGETLALDLSLTSYVSLSKLLCTSLLKQNNNKKRGTGGRPLSFLTDPKQGSIAHIPCYINTSWTQNLDFGL